MVLSNFTNFGSNYSKDEQEQMLHAVVNADGVDDTTTFIDINDKIDFKCQRCGACCLNRDDILLNAYDVYRISKHLGMSCFDFVKSYTEIGLSGDKRLPTIKLKTNQLTGYCPFLMFDYMHGGVYKCKINDVKPGACASHPLGILSMCDRDDTDHIETTLVKVEQCDKSKVGNMINVRDHMAYYFNHEKEYNLAHILSITVANNFDWRLLYFISMACTASLIKKGLPLKDDIMASTINVVASVALHYIYFEYDINEYFIPQAEENLAIIKHLFVEPFNEHELLMEAMCGIFTNCTGEDPKEVLKYADEHGIDIEDILKEYADGKRKIDYEGFKKKKHPEEDSNDYEYSDNEEEEAYDDEC